ncbi:GIY-YIG nuclease family protein [Rossellomorea aquimaris]|uniref:GIY-YIG nuclease family protein n=1 Tax=Rossellomorea aquimaris TaxID=189382 RepID=UPI0005C8BC59|nr:GIY-YIG nuclease family protein [Rossellomorea aquimaris]
MDPIIKFKTYGVYEYFVWEQLEISKIGGYGVYIFFDIEGDPIYVGRATNIGGRVCNHIQAKTKELARNKKGMIVKEHYKFLHSVKLIKLSTTDFIWFEAFTIAKLKPVFNKDLRSDIPDDKTKQNQDYHKAVDHYYRENEMRKRDNWYSEWPYYQRKLMEFYKSKRLVRYGIGIEDIVLMEVFKTEIVNQNIEYGKADLKEFNRPKKPEDNRNHKEEIINYIISSSSGWTKDMVLKKAKTIGMKDRVKLKTLIQLKL